MNRQSRNINALRRFGAGLLMVALALSTGASVGRADDGNKSGANNNEVRLRTNLSGGAINGKTPSGHADFRMETSRNRSRLNVEVQDVNLAAGTMLQVVITHGGVPANAGSITLNGFGAGELELNSQDGDTVPAIVKGDVVAVMNGAATILMGVF